MELSSPLVLKSSGVERLFLAVPRGCLQFVIVVFPDHTHLLFWIKSILLRPKNLIKFSLVTMLTLDGFGKKSKTISVTS